MTVQRRVRPLVVVEGPKAIEGTLLRGKVPWREITGMRHKLIHDYFVVDLGIVWSTATVNVPLVEPLIRAAAATLGVPEPPNGRAR